MKILSLVLASIALFIAVSEYLKNRKLKTRVKYAEWVGIEDILKDSHCVYAKDSVMTEEWIDDHKVIRVFPHELKGVVKFKVLEERWGKIDDSTFIGIVDKYIIEE